MNVLVFDIETVPDIKGAESIWDVNGLSESDVKSFCLLPRLQETSGRTDFLKHHLHKIVSISVAVRNKTTFKLWSLERSLLMKKNYWKDFSWASKNMNQHLFLGMVMALIFLSFTTGLLSMKFLALYIGKWDLIGKSSDLIIINLDIITDILT